MTYPVTRPLMRLLPEYNLWDSVNTERPIARRGIIFRLRCSHKDETGYTRTDHRPGPGWMSDSYSGLVCVSCGKVLQEQRTY